MALNLRCPICSQPAVVPDSWLDRRARCNACQSVYSVRDAVQCRESSMPSDDVSAPEEGMSRSDKLIWGLGLGIPVMFLIVFLAYIFGTRDTWEADNYSKITDRCKVIESAIVKSDDTAAVAGCEELFRFIGDRKIGDEYLAERVDAARKAYAPARTRLDEARRTRETRELAERQEREAREQAESRQREAREAADAAHRPRERYYRDRFGDILSESETENKLSVIRRYIAAMPDTLERAFREGQLRAAEKEWDRIKRYGPIGEP